MSEQDQPQSEGNSQQVQMNHVTARVPEEVSRGAFSTGVIVMTGGSEFILDFIQNIGGPPQVAARVIMPHGALPQFADALKKNLEIYTTRFGPPPELPKPPQPAKPQSAQELYDELKLPDSLLSGAYSNGVMIGHSASEFKLDFLTNLFPHSAVSSRVYLSAPQVPRLLDSLTSTFQQFQERVRQQQQNQQQQQPPPQQQQTPPPPPPESSEDEMG
ncbi:MAG: DUF3467 domain-containing protein [Planctomycetes bacterium]|nr:DUF3467 domain-containing protein [Planctomycetota bacterium]